MKPQLLVAAVLSALCLSACRPAQDALVRIPVPPRPAGQQDMIGFAAEPMDTVRIGIIGLGMRGPGAVKRMTCIEGAKIVALCDLYETGVRKAQEILAAAGKPAAAEYFGDAECWRKLAERDDLDLVYIVTDWKNHAPMAKYAMECGKHAAVEVPAAPSLAELWDLIDTSERTRRHCMMLENCVYDFFELTTLNMAQHGLFGEIVHAEGGYIHTLDEFWDLYWDDWRMRFNRENRGDVYPTHGIGPVCQALNIHRGDRMTRLVTMDTRSWRGTQLWEKKYGPIPEGEPAFQNGDHTMTMIQTEKGKTILIEHDVMTPRPYDRLYQLTGTKGFANKYPVQGFMFAQDELGGEVEVENLEAHKFVPDAVRDKLLEEYKHPIARELEESAKRVGGHGGMDYIMDYRLIYCLRKGLPLDMDVYDLAEWSCLGELSRISLEHGNAPVEIPDFTRGAWDKLPGFSLAL